MLIRASLSAAMEMVHSLISSLRVQQRSCFEIVLFGPSGFNQLTKLIAALQSRARLRQKRNVGFFRAQQAVASARALLA